MKLDSDRLECVDDQTAKIYRNMAPFQRLEIASGLWNTARTMLLNGLRSLHPDWDEEKIRRETAKRMSHGAA